MAIGNWFIERTQALGYNRPYVKNPGLEQVHSRFDEFALWATDVYQLLNDQEDRIAELEVRVRELEQVALQTKPR